MKLAIKVTPSARKNEVVEDIVDSLGQRILKIKVGQPPEDGKANKAMIEILAKYFAVKKSAFEIISGETSRNKIVKINN
jgi:uncharacterized protein (TIGR00251 family)